MIEKTQSGEPPLRRLLLPLSWLYGLVSGATRLCYELKLRRAWRAPVPVVVVGNLTVDGDGKTLIAVWLVEQPQQRGIRVGVVSRGYGGKAESCPLLLSADTTTVQTGDEPVLVYQRTGAPVAVSPVRSDAIKAVLAQHLDVQIIVIDGGSQHYRPARDVGIVVVDGVRRFGNGWWLPAGPMHERTERLKSVDAIIVNGGAPRNGEIPMHLLPGQVANLCAGTRCDVVQLEHVVVITGIGHLSCFFATLKMCDVQPGKCVLLVNRQPLSHADVSALASAG